MTYATETEEITNSDDYLDVRDIIARVEALEDTEDDDEKAELKTLTTLLDDLKGNGGDEQWKGDWYPITLIRDSYFVEAMQQLVEDIGDMPKGLPQYLAVDWDQTAENLRVDYSSVEFDGVTYWYR